MLILNKYFYKNKKSKLCIGDRVAVLNDMFYEYGGSNVFLTRTCYTRHPYPPGPPGHRPAPRTVLQVKKTIRSLFSFTQRPQHPRRLPPVTASCRRPPPDPSSPASPPSSCSPTAHHLLLAQPMTSSRSTGSSVMYLACAQDEGRGGERGRA
jgi:hypothetical protein